MANQKNLAIYPGSFDPPTFGHFDIIERSSKLFSRVVVAIGHSPLKPSLFTIEERAKFLEKLCENFPNVEVGSYEGLTVDYANEVGADIIIRGLRTDLDYSYESQMAVTNRILNKKVDSLFLVASPDYNHISSTLVRDIASHQGDLSKFVPDYVVKALKLKFK